VKLYIAEATNEKTKQPLSNGTKNKLCQAYDWYCKANGIQWKKPYYKEAEHIPIIPTTDAVTKIITASSKQYAVIFTIMTEIAVEPAELHNTQRRKIDAQRGVISITGTKGHASANYTLKKRTAEMLREYLATHTKEYPFPRPESMS
jgi:hypothetical protein